MDVLDKIDPATAGDGAFAADLLRGHTETIVLGVLNRSDSYGFEIFKTIREATGGAHEIKEATLYATFRRLVRDGLVEAYWGDETQGGRRKYYRITDAGRAVYERNVKAWRVTRTIIDSLLDAPSQRILPPRAASPRTPTNATNAVQQPRSEQPGRQPS